MKFNFAKHQWFDFITFISKTHHWSPDFEIKLNVQTQTLSFFVSFYQQWRSIQESLDKFPKFPDQDRKDNGRKGELYFLRLQIFMVIELEETYSFISNNKRSTKSQVTPIGVSWPKQSGWAIDALPILLPNFNSFVSLLTNCDLVCVGRLLEYIYIQEYSRYINPHAHLICRYLVFGYFKFLMKGIAR